MRTSLNDIKLIEDHIEGRLDPGSHLLLKARAIIDPAFKSNMHLQKKIYELVRIYGRRKLRSDIEKVSKNLFEASRESAFKNKIIDIFT